MAVMATGFSVLIAAAVLLGFIGLWRLTSREDPVEARLNQFAATAAIPLETGAAGKKKRLGALDRSLRRLSLAGSLADRLSRADVALTVAEFVLLDFLAAGILGLLGWMRGGFLLAVVLFIAGVFIPLIYLNMRASKRRDAFASQLPDVLTLLVGALRAGQGTTQAIGTLVGRMPKPSSQEFAHVMRAVSLGVPVTRALNDMADRAGSDDLYLVVTAMNVQAELGGNLAQILETITETVRERIRIKREIRVLTSQQRMTGYMLAALPIIVGFIISLIAPGYLAPLFTPGIGMAMLVGAAVMMVIGFLIIGRIIAIDV